jgi:hypothetical protein
MFLPITLGVFLLGLSVRLEGADAMTESAGPEAA